MARGSRDGSSTLAPDITGSMLFNEPGKKRRKTTARNAMTRVASLKRPFKLKDYFRPKTLAR